VTHAHDRHLQTGIAGSVAIHALLLLLLVGVLSTQPAQDFLRQEEALKPKEPEVTLIFADQLIPEPPPVPEKQPQYYIRTTQNEASKVKPSNAPFISDRSTTAASQKPAVAGATLPMPTLDGTAPKMGELANRDYKDGQFKNDSAIASRPQAKIPPPQQQPPPPPPPPSPPQLAVAKVTPTPLTKMMEQMDRQTADQQVGRLPLEVRKADPTPTTPPDTPAPAPESPPVAMPPQVRIPEDTPPPILKAMPVEDTPVERNTPNPEKDAFSPFTRTGKTDGSINQEGPDAVDAEATPLGIYMRQVQDAVGKRWHLYVRLGKDSVTFGRVRFRFYVDKKGTPQDLKILSDARDADPRMRELTLRAILDAQIPPIPADLLPTLDDGRVKIEYEAIIY